MILPCLCWVGDLHGIIIPRANITLWELGRRNPILHHGLPTGSPHLM